MRTRGERMPDYKEMYFALFRATEQAIQLLIAAQRKCEEAYIEAPEENLIILPNGQKEEEQ